MATCGVAGTGLQSTNLLALEKKAMQPQPTWSKLKHYEKVGDSSARTLVLTGGEETVGLQI
jgi:hypothetical protein